MLELRDAPRRTSPFALAICIALASCASTASSSDSAKPAVTGRPARVVYMNYSAGAAGQRLEIVNQSHTDRTELYSRARPLEDAVTKVTTDEVMDELIGFFRTKGFFEKAEAGPAPRTSDGLYTQALEIETPSERVHMSVQKGLPPAERQRFLECAQAFVMIYNDTYQLQSVDRAPDWDERPPPPGVKKSSGQ